MTGYVAFETASHPLHSSFPLLLSTLLSTLLSSSQVHNTMSSPTDQPTSADIKTDSRTRAFVPATEEDTELLNRWLYRMPFAGDTFATGCRAVEAEPLPPVNERGGRDAEGWTAVYEATVKEGECVGGEGSGRAVVGRGCVGWGGC